MADASCPMPVTGPLVHDQGLAEMVARLVMRPAGQGYHPEVEESIGFPAWVAESLREGQRLLEMACGPLVLAEFAAQNTDHEIGVRHVTAAIDRAEYVPATTQQGEGLGRLSLLAASPSTGSCGIAGAAPSRSSGDRRRSWRTAACALVK